MILQLIHAAILGLVEGLTEFIPVSSTGHLILTQDWLGFDRLVGKNVADTFDVFIQTGAILAVVVAYPGRFRGLLRLRIGTGFAGPRGLALLALTTLPALVVGMAAHGYIKQYLFSPATVAVGLAAGAAWMLLAERFPRPVHRVGLDEVGWRDALAVGLFQCVAMWPGVSRAAATILGGMAVGLERKTATEYSFFAAVPVLLAAAAYDLYKNLGHLQASHVPLFGVGLAVAFLSALAAVRWLIRFVGHHSLAPFAWYRLALAAAVAWMAW